ncbi:hypothetical protein SUDANB1_00405 [Streptomyces sp. enrichment culture]
MHVLVGWCTLHAVIYFALLTLAFWLVQLAWQGWPERSSKPRPTAAPRVPHWARTGHLPPPSSRPQGRHRRGVSR